MNIQEVSCLYIDIKNAMNDIEMGCIKDGLARLRVIRDNARADLDLSRKPKEDK